MSEKSYTTISYFINITLYFVLGNILFFLPLKTLSLVHLIISLSILLIGSISTLINIFKNKDLKDAFFSLILTFIGGIILNNGDKFLLIFPLVTSLYVLLNGIIKIITVYIYKSRGFKGFNRLFLNGVLDLLFFIYILSNLTENLRRLTIFLGIYFLLVSFNYLLDFLEDNFPKSFLFKKRRIRITSPVIVSAFFPYSVYTKINKFLNDETTSVNINKNTSGKVDLEIFITVKESNIGKLGHADLWFENKIYSYGHYDEESKTFFDMIGDGVLFTVNDRDKYLKFCTSHSKKTIFAFGITLTDEEKKNVRDELNKIKANTYRWETPQELNKNEEYVDYASCLYRATKAKFYKFSKSTYKLYFAAWTNCVKLVDNILDAAGEDESHLNGIITPGAYYQYLNNEYKKKNSKVIRKEIITNEDILTKNKK